jgi:uncharacterized protein
MRRLPILLPLLGIVFTPGLAAAQSFNCQRASYPDEKRICAEPALSRLDEQLAAVYDDAIRRLGPSRARQLDNEETAWVVERRRCGADYGCIERSYLGRIAELAAMASPPRTASQPAPHAPTPPAAPPSRPERPVAAAPRPAPPPSGSSAPRSAAPVWINPAPSQ